MSLFVIPAIETLHKGENQGGKLFSILIPTWNNLPLLQLCISSIQKNSFYQHQIVVHVNEGTDGSIAWIREQGLDATYSKENAGVCASLNASAQLAQCDYIVYMNDDMYVCPNWDLHLYQAIQKRNDDLFYYSSTMIEFEKSSSKAVYSPFDFGRNIDTFREQDLIDFVNNPSNHPADWFGSCWPPSIVSRRVWNLLGGYDELFSPGFYSDPDFGMKCWQIGIRDFKGIGNSLVYHFKSKSTGRVIRNDGRKSFAKKWGIPSSYLYEKMLRMGEKVDANELKENKGLAYLLARLKAKWIAGF
ncbi:MAG: glycosyltransferase family 2 protein [Bacteroidia bacterium]